MHKSVTPQSLTCEYVGKEVRTPFQAAGCALAEENIAVGGSADVCAVLACCAQNAILREEVQRLRERVRVMDEEVSRTHRYQEEP